MPALFVLLAMVFAEIRPPNNEQPPLELQPWQYIPKRGDQHLYVFYRYQEYRANDSTVNG
jgi:hypothetical protein